MGRISPERLIIGASLIFFVGIFVFAIIFKALTLLGSVESTVGVLVGASESQISYYTQVFQLLPWILGFMYLIFVGGVVYMVLRKGKKEEAGEELLFPGVEEGAQVEESFEDIFYRERQL